MSEEALHTVYIPFYSEQVKSADPVTYDDNGDVIPLSERFNEEKNDIRFAMKTANESLMDDMVNGSERQAKITAGMSEEERYDALKDAELSVSVYNADQAKITRAEVERLERATRRDARRYVKTLFEKFGLGKAYVNKQAEIEFKFSGMGFDKSVYEQNARTANYSDFGIMLANLEEIVENAIPLEIHPDKYAGTVREDKDLNRTLVFVSAYENDGIVPVQLEVKEFIEKDNSLYVAVTLNKIKDVVFTKENVSNDTPAMAAHISTISLRDLFANINPSDGEFLKYVPDGFLKDAQRVAKEAALDKEREKVGRIPRLPLKHAGLGVMAGSVMSQRTDQALQNGATPEQALALGTAAALIEVVTEKVSLDRILNPKMAGSAKQIVMEVLKQAGVEASEEMASEVLNTMADVQIMQGDSEWEQAIAAYMAEDPTMTRQQAEAKVFGDKTLAVLLSGAGGFLSGGVMGGGNVMLSNYIAGLGSGGNVVNALSVGTKAVGQYQQDLQTYGTLSADAIADAIKDISSLPLDAETKKAMIGDASAIANQPANHIPQAVAASYRQSIDAIQTAANRARTIGADYAARKAKVTARLTRMLDSVASARSEAEAALNRGDLAAHHAAVMKAQKAMEDYRAEYSVAEAEAAALQAKQTEQESELANKAKEEAAKLRADVERAATWQDKLMAVREHLSDQEWNAMSLEEQEAMVDATIARLDSEFDQDQIAANMAEAFVRGDQSDAEFWESLLYHDLTPDSINDTVMGNQAEGEADGRDSISRTESDLAQDARRGEEQNAGREGRDGAQASGTAQSAWGARQEQDVTNAVAEYNRTHAKQMPVGSIRKAGKISEAVQKVADYIKGITGRDSFFVASDTDLIGGFQTNDRRYVVYTGDPMTDLFNLAHENGHSSKDFLDIIYAALDSGEIPNSSFQAYVKQRTENIARKQGVPVSRVNESQNKLREEFACDMLGLYMTERYFGTANWNQYGVPESSRKAVRNAFDAVLRDSQRNTSQQNGRASERTADDELYDSLLRTGAAISEQDALGESGVGFSENATEQRHSPEMLRVIEEYEKSVDESVLGAVEKYRANKNAPYSRMHLSDVSQREAADLRRILGSDFSGYSHNADKSTFNHISRRHGPDGVHDHTMTDPKDVARMTWVLNNYDAVERTLDQNGEPAYSKYHNGANGKSAPLVTYSKRIDGHYYVIEAAADNKYKNFGWNLRSEKKELRRHPLYKPWM